MHYGALSSKRRSTSLHFELNLVASILSNLTITLTQKAIRSKVNLACLESKQAKLTFDRIAF